MAGVPEQEPEEVIDMVAEIAAADAEAMAAHDEDRRATDAADQATLCPRCGKPPAKDKKDPNPIYCAGGTR